MSVKGFYVSPPFGGAAGTRSRLRWGQMLPTIGGGVLSIALVLCAGSGLSAESSPPPSEAAPTEATNSEQLIRVCLQIQQQLQTMQVALEQNRKEAVETTAQNAATLSNRLGLLEEAFASQRTREFELLQNSARETQKSNRAMLLVAGSFAGVCVLSLLIMTFFQWRMGCSLAAISTALGPLAHGLGPATELAALGPGDGHPGGPTELSSLRLLSAIEQLDRHIHDFKGVVSGGGNGETISAPNGNSGLPDTGPTATNERSRISALLDKAQELVSSDDPNAALACFDEVLALEPNHKDALVKKGAALERQHKLNEAIECYDRAIAVDDSMTIAYLHKGGLCNRLERFKEALECYEKALRTHDQRGG